MIELSQEVESWYVGLGLPGACVRRASHGSSFCRGSKVGDARSRSLGEGLRELRFSCESVARGITYVIDTEWTIITLTTFRKQRDNERREIQRAKRIKKRRGEST